MLYSTKQIKEVRIIKGDSAFTVIVKDKETVINLDRFFFGKNTVVVKEEGKMIVFSVLIYKKRRRFRPKPEREIIKKTNNRW